jgi:hypothetical protein
MQFMSPYWDEKIKIELLQRWILVHSYLYYDMNTSVVSDEMFDRNSKQLTDLSDAYPEALKKSRYYYVMKDFDGSTGFGYTQNLNENDFDCVTRDACGLMKYKGGI